MLCPICGMQSDTTSVVCSKHVSIIYDTCGRVISYWDYPYKPWQDYRSNEVRILKYDDNGNDLRFF